MKDSTSTYREGIDAFRHGGRHRRLDGPPNVATTALASIHGGGLTGHVFAVVSLLFVGLHGEVESRSTRVQPKHLQTLAFRGFGTGTYRKIGEGEGRS